MGKKVQLNKFEMKLILKKTANEHILRVKEKKIKKQKELFEYL